MPLDTARIHEIPDDPLAAIDYCYEQGWTDGLPVVPPAVKRVEDMMLFEGRPPETVLAAHPATGLRVHRARRRRQCRDGWLQARILPRRRRRARSDERARLQFSWLNRQHRRFGALADRERTDHRRHRHEQRRQSVRPGNRANNTIGRAIRLILMNVFQMIPGLSDKSTQGIPVNSVSASPSASAAIPGRCSSTTSTILRAFPASPCLPAAASATSKITAATRRNRCCPASPTRWLTTAA